MYLSIKRLLMKYKEQDIIYADFVWTWVDGSDEKWVTKYNQYILYKIDKFRYTSNNEIIYSLLCYHKFMNWHKGRILLITDEQIPALYKLPLELQQRITIVDHTEFIPKIFLPTFNSIIIELWIPFINGLSNLFVYWNDDFLVWKETPIEYFFNKSEDKLVGYTENKQLFMCTNKNRQLSSNYHQTYKKTCDTFPDIINTENYISNHSPRIYDKQMLLVLHHIYKDVFLQQYPYKIRSRNNINTIALYDAWLKKLGLKLLIKEKDTDYNHLYLNINVVDNLNKDIYDKYNIICINITNNLLENKLKQNIDTRLGNYHQNIDTRLGNYHQKNKHLVLLILSFIIILSICLIWVLYRYY